ncbi:MAG: gamma-glutamyltransferase [Rhodospirillales bacterium RIFCSPLOWO2_12_FULL_58_28]|nr:MAG: gamma-glutamyltransferase [Rhodospirillales bacterium RIFCSPLOWO2_02_FULL_58_16]OHC79121.1 MAG: gamma-glutamyltransferase [Rhodospirillales bacterium RIFCSPLOWO2_12_FULL_58_28]
MKYAAKTIMALAMPAIMAGCQTSSEKADVVKIEAEAVKPAEPVRAARQMISTANPLATEAGLKMLREGGSAVDAAIAAGMVLNLVEPQSSGIGGGGFMIHFAAKSGEIASYDGRETAPASATPYMFLDGQGRPRKFNDVVAGGLSVGVPGLLRMLETAHKEHGKLPWKQLFEPAIKLATEGFTVSKRLNAMIDGTAHIKDFPEAAAYFLTKDGKAKPEGSKLVNKQLAETFRLISTGGADAFYNGGIADDIVATVRKAGKNNGSMKTADLASYKAIKRDPTCLFYRVWMVCGMGPPSSGGIATLQILGILQKFDMAALKPEAGAPALPAVHLMIEAGRLAFADRSTYIADPAFIPVPVSGMLDPGYLDSRAAEISKTKSMGKAMPGMPGASSGLRPAPDDSSEGVSTTHLSVVDSDGNAVSLTSSIEDMFGSRLMVRGFLLNNQLTDFSFSPIEDGVQIANRAEPGKRPRSSMAPTMVFDGDGRVVMAVGSPGGPHIISYVAKTLIAALDWRLNIRQAVDLPNFTNLNGAVELEQGTALEAMKKALTEMGHEVRINPLVSGLHAVTASREGLAGAADKRLEGAAQGD